MVRCTTCNERIKLTIDGTFFKHPHGKGQTLCGMSGHFPACAYCKRQAAFDTVIPELRVCGPCNDATMRRDSIQRCQNPKCSRGRVICENHTGYVRTGKKCHACHDFNGDKTCADCDGHGVVYVPRELENP